MPLFHFFVCVLCICVRMAICVGTHVYSFEYTHVWALRPMSDVFLNHSLLFIFGLLLNSELTGSG